MPEHVHLILRPDKDAAVSDILSAIKQPVAKRTVNWVRKNAPSFLLRMEDIQPNGKRTYRFWQRGGGYDRNMFSGEEVREKINYIHMNPVRRGLVSHPRDWPWSSYVAWQDAVDEPRRIDRGTIRGR